MATPPCSLEPSKGKFTNLFVYLLTFKTVSHVDPSWSQTC